MKFAFRQLLKSPGFTMVALLTLALGIGVNTTTFTLVNALLYRLPPFGEPHRIVEIFGTTPQDPFSAQAPANVRDEMRQSTVFEQMAPWTFAASSMGRPGEPAIRLSGLAVAGYFFATLGASPILGRPFTRADDTPGHNDVVLVSERFWKDKLGGDPHAVGSLLRIDGKPVTLIGVMPDSIQDLESFGPIDLWQPLGYGEDNWHIRNNPWLSMVARLKPGVSVAQAQAQMSTIAARLAHDHPDTNSQHGLNVSPYEDVRRQGSTNVLWSIMGLMLFVLLIACVNLANLQLARTAGQTRDNAIRVALGASRGHLIRQLLSESLLLSIAGGALGLLLAVWGNRLLGSNLQMGPDVRGLDLRVDHRVLGFTFAAAVATGIAFGLMPAWIASRTDVNRSLKQSGRGSTGDRSKHRVRQALVVAELALALALLAGAAFFVKGIQKLARIDPGWQTKDEVTGSFALSYNTYKDNDQVRAVVGRLESALGALPGVDRVAIAGTLPITGFSHRSNFLIQGEAAPQKGSEPMALVERATPGYFSTLDIRLLKGRLFTSADKAASAQVVVINRAMADTFWPHGDAIGHFIGDPDPKNPQWREIIGIVNDITFPVGLGASGDRYQTYRPFAQDTDHWLSFAIHSENASPTLSDAARRAVARVDPDLAVYNLDTVDALIAKFSANNILVEQMLIIAAALGLFLALVGIYGVVAHLAAQRTQEIGIRMALGAQAGTLLWLILRNGARLAAMGTGIGLLLAFALSRGLALAMPQIPGQDPLLAVGLAVLLSAATLLACWLPALRATRVNPVEALRAE